MTGVAVLGILMALADTAGALVSATGLVLLSRRCEPETLKPAIAWTTFLAGGVVGGLALWAISTWAAS